MEIALTALASLGTAAAGAGAAAGVGEAALLAGTGAAAGAAGGAAAGFSLGSTALSILSGASTAVSVLQTLNAGSAKADAAALHAREAEIEGVGAQAAGQVRQARLKRELLRTLGENDVAYAASGVDLGYGEAAGTRSRMLERGEREIAIDEATTEAQVAGYGARSAGYNRLARQYRRGSLLSAVANAGEGVARAYRRGVA